MRLLLPMLTLVLFLGLAAILLCSKPQPRKGSHLHPAEEYLLSLQYPAFGEGLSIYRSAVWNELRKTRKTRAFGNWQQEGPFNTGGRLNCIAIHPVQANTWFVGCADGGIFKTTDGANTWQPVFDMAPSLSVSELVIDSTNPLIMYAGTGDQVLGGYSHVGSGVFKSTDGGLSWNASGLTNTGAVTRIIIDPSNSQILYAGTMGNPFVSDTNRGVYKSIDGGATWNRILFLGPNAGIGDLLIHPQNSQILYATGRRRFRSDLQSVIYGPEARIYRSINGGVSWDTLSTGLPAGEQCRIGLCISKQNPSVLYANYVDTTLEFSGLYKTTNGGNSWSLINSMSTPNAGGFGWYFGEIRISPVNDNVLFVLGVGLYKSTNGGNTFVADNGTLHADKHDLRFVSSTEILLATDGGFYKSGDGGSTWTMKNNLPITQFYELAYNPFDSLNYYGGAQDNGSNFGSLGTGINNWMKYFGGDGFRSQFNPVDDQVFYAEWQNGNVMATSDAGANFSTLTQSILLNDRCSWNSPYMISHFDPDVLYFGSYRVYKNTTGPVDSWQPISNDLTDGTNNTFHVITTIDQSRLNAQVLYAGTSDARVWVTQNEGINWSPVYTGLSNRNISCVAASPDSLSSVFVSQTGYRNNDSNAHIYFSNNYGANWNSVAGNLPAFAINDIWIQPGSKDSHLVVASDGGVYATANRGIQWQRVGNNMPIMPVFDLEYNPATKRLAAGTYARSLMTIRIDSIFSVKSTIPDAVPTTQSPLEFTLYPNPAIDKVMIEANVPILQVDVFDIRGIRIGLQKGNLNQAQLNCSSWARGMYVLRIRTDRGYGYRPLLLNGG